MIRAYDEIVAFIAAGSTPAMVATFEASASARNRVADLIRREKTSGLTDEDKSELEHFLQLEHVMRLAKAQAAGRQTQ